jgi:predicted dehydrogenase
MSSTKIGIIGTGNISPIYMAVCKSFAGLDLAACADLDLEKARRAAGQNVIARACSVDELLADPDIEIVVNLTPPAVHARLAMAALASGKSVYNEKPLALTREDAQQMLEMAASRGLRIGCAPDTFLGAGLQTCRKLIDEGAIGFPVAATAFMLCHGHEGWHPDPEFYYQVGGGPLFDMGPYYLTALVSLLGPVARVSGSARITFPERIIGSAPKKGQKITVEVPTHVSGLLDFASGATVTMITSFDVWRHALPHIEIYGSEGSLSVPDPNTFGGPVRLWRAAGDSWEDIPLISGYPQNSRGLGVADMAEAMKSGRPHRANASLAYHVLDIMHAIHDSSRQGKHIPLSSTCERPEPFSGFSATRYTG